jgi:hypothetical protein
VCAALWAARGAESRRPVWGTGRSRDQSGVLWGDRVGVGNDAAVANFVVCHRTRFFNTKIGGLGTLCHAQTLQFEAFARDWRVNIGRLLGVMMFIRVRTWSNIRK